ncbi:MAG: hypothetical protein P8176_10405, partial [Gammaproteobacteria bacterium]
CGLCHGNQGEGAVAWPTPLRADECQLVNCGDVAALTNYIANNMPSPGACVGECASKTAELIVELNGPASAPPSAVFASEYDARCVSCHGAAGEGNVALSISPIAPGVCVNVDCADVLALGTYIATTMPPPGGTCVGDCASQTAMVVNGFSANAPGAEVGVPLTPPPAAADLTPPQRFCREQFILDDFPDEMALMCENGEPSTAFLQAMAAPYVGGATPAPPLLINQAADGISKFATIGAIRINKPIDAVFAQRAALNNFNLTAGSATIDSVQTAVIAPQGAGHEGGFEMEVNTTVRVLFVNINIDMKQQREFFDLSGDGMIRADLTRLKPNDPLNVDNILSNVVGFMMSEGDSTLLVSVVLQEVDNQGFPDQALQTFSSLTPALKAHAFTVLSN